MVKPPCTGNATAPTHGHCCPVGVPQEASPRPPEGLYTLIPSGQQILWVGNSHPVRERQDQTAFAMELSPHSPLSVVEKPVNIHKYPLARMSLKREVCLHSSFNVLSFVTHLCSTKYGDLPTRLHPRQQCPDDKVVETLREWLESEWCHSREKQFFTKGSRHIAIIILS